MVGKEMSAINLSKYIIAESYNLKIDDLSNKKLQKLLYYVQAWTLVFYNKKAFEEDIEAWVHGPAIPSVYRAYKDFAFNPIPVSLADGIATISDDIKSVVKDVLKVYGKFDANYLETLTHTEDPWQIARGESKPFQNSSNIISLDTMKTYYGQRLKEAKG